MVTKNIQVSITNDNYLNYMDNGRIEISNHDWYSDPDKKYYYNVELDNLTADFYIAFGHRVKGVFRNINFSSNRDTFFDLNYFKNVIFENCYFDRIDIRWCKFDNCQFINCSGVISYIRASTFKKNCVFQNTSIDVKSVDEYMWLNARRYTYGVIIE